MSTWGELRKKFLGAVGKRNSAEQEAWDHLSEGYRRVASQLDLPELRVPDATVTVALGDHYFDYDCDAYAIRSIFNSTDGQPMHQESGGLAGYNRFLEASSAGTPKPPSGTPTRYVRAGNRVYFRDRAARETIFVVQFDLQVPEITASNINEHPVTPAQYDLAIVYLAVRAYFLAHPDEDTSPEGQPSPSRKMADAAEEILARSKDPVAIESKAERTVVRVTGYRLLPRSAGRRWR